MLESLSKQIAHCYFRAAECRKLAERSEDLRDQQFYLEREQAWFSLARSYEFQERLGRMLQERRRPRRYHSTRRNICTAMKPPKCLTCCIETQFVNSRLLARQPFESSEAIHFERALFLCPNCHQLSEHVVAMTKESQADRYG